MGPLSCPSTTVSISKWTVDILHEADKPRSIVVPIEHDEYRVLAHTDRQAIRSLRRWDPSRVLNYLGRRLADRLTAQGRVLIGPPDIYVAQAPADRWLRGYDVQYNRDPAVRGLAT